jgi:hypothetical protein
MVGGTRPADWIVSVLKSCSESVLTHEGGVGQRLEDRELSTKRYYKLCADGVIG